MRARRRMVHGVVLALLLAAVAAGCAGGDQPTDTPPLPSSVSSRSSSTIDPKAQPAVTAYEAYARTARNAARDPLPNGSTYPPEADFTRYSFDPSQAEYAAYVSALAESGVAFRGTPPRPRVKVVSVEPDAKPYPLVTLTDCPTPAPDWRGYRGNKLVPRATPSAEPPPYLITAKVIFYKEHWGVQSTSIDTSRTCAG